MRRPTGLGEFTTNELIAELDARGIRVERLDVVDPDTGWPVIHRSYKHFTVRLKKQDGGQTLKIVMEDGDARTS